MKKITLFMMLLCLGQFVKAQNTCATAQVVNGAGIYAVGIINGSQVPEPLCEFQYGAVPAGNVPAGEWYAYTPTAAHTVTISTDIAANNPRKDTRVHIYTGTCAALTCVAGDDDSGANNSSIVTFNVAANATYYIAFDNRWLNLGANTGFSFQLTETAVIVPPPTPITYVAQTISTINSAYNLCVVDMNGDHKDDIVGVSQNSLKIHYQQNGGFFVGNFAIAGTSKMPSWSMAAGDYNKDGFNDLLLGEGNGLSFWRSNNTGTAYTSITPGDYIFCQRTNFVDLNNDGNLDAFSCHDIDPNVYYINNGSGEFTYNQSGTTPGAYMLGVTPSGGNYASLWSDFDNDGDVDLFISKCSGPPCELHRNDGNGVFTDISAVAQVNITPIQSWSSAILDYDNDGDMDILIGSNGSTKSRLLKNNLNTSNNVEEAFTNISAGSGWDADTSVNRDYIAYDFDNDGFVDVMGGGNKIMFNQGGTGVFAPVSYPGLNVGAVGDLNNDGFLDFLNGNTIRYAVPNANNWIKVSTQGVLSNGNGIGARVEIYGAWGKQIRDIRSGEGFEFMSSLNAHFGIGTATSITKVVINWPSGTQDVILNPAINQMLFVLEGSSPALAVNQNTQAAFSLYPNPVKDVLNINNNATSNVKSAQIFDLTGKLLLSSDVIDQKISVQKLSTGTYIIILVDAEGKKSTQKFLKN